MPVQVGDIIGIKYSQDNLAAAIVLHVSKKFIKNGAIAGVFRKAFGDIKEIDITELEAEKPDLLGVPNYISVKAIKPDIWPKVGNSKALLEYYGVPLLRAGYDLYQGDDFVRKVDSIEWSEYSEISAAGRSYLQNMLARELADIGNHP